MSALGDTLAALARVLDERALGWYVFGAQAVAIRGAPRATQDVDVTVAVSRGELQALLDELAAAGLEPRWRDQMTADDGVWPQIGFPRLSSALHSVGRV